MGEWVGCGGGKKAEGVTGPSEVSGWLTGWEVVSFSALRGLLEIICL